MYNIQIVNKINQIQNNNDTNFPEIDCERYNLMTCFEKIILFLQQI